MEKGQPKLVVLNVVDIVFHRFRDTLEPLLAKKQAVVSETLGVRDPSHNIDRARSQKCFSLGNRSSHLGLQPLLNKVVAMYVVLRFHNLGLLNHK
jgi:hypothetical protein